MNTPYTTEFLRELGLLPYQVDWIRDLSRFKVGLWSRQSGKDFTCAAEAVLDCHARDRTHWLIIAASERQAVESLAKATAWAERLHLWLANQTRAENIPRFESRAGEIEFSNGSRITALPGKSNTVRGFSANLILTEFAFHDDPEKLWHAVYPMITNPLQGGEKMLRIITTPNGLGTFFHRLWLDSDFSKHRVTIHDAVAAGLPVDIPALRRGLNDPEAWAREYECQFTDSSTVLLPFDLIETCVSDQVTETSNVDLLSQCAGELLIGIDFGRKHDLTVCWTLERSGALLWTREVLVLECLPTPGQFALLAPRVRLARRVCLDATGAGVGLGDLLARAYPSKMELCSFTQKLKDDLFPKLRAAFERRTLRIPDSRSIREDLHGVRKIVSSNGQISYRASHSPDGHSDRCTALALALRAAENAPRSAPATSVGQAFRSTW